MKTKTIVRLSAAILALSMTACSTVRGVGNDVQSVGSGISRGASSVQRQITN